MIGVFYPRDGTGIHNKVAEMEGELWIETVYKNRNKLKKNI
jgi:hypothetical protein